MNIHRIYIYAPVAGVLPVDLEQALAQGEQLRQGGGGQEVPQSLLKMAEQLEDYVRGLSEGAEEELEEDILVNDLNDLLLGMKDWLVSKGVPIITFEMPVEGWRHLLWQIVELARPVGLVVVDGELMMAFLPTGKVYPESKSSYWSGIVSSIDVEERRYNKEILPRTVRQYIKWSKPYYERYLLGKGFRKNGKTKSEVVYYSKDYDFVSVRVYFDFQMNFPCFYGLNSMGINSKVICDILRLFGVEPIDDDIVFYLRLHDQVDEAVLREMPPISYSSVKWEINLFDQYVMGVLEHITNVQQLDCFLSELQGYSDDSRDLLGAFILQRLVIAKMADRTDFEIFVSDLRATIPPLHKKSLDIFDEVAEYLRKTPPFVNI